MREVKVGSLSLSLFLFLFFWSFFFSFPFLLYNIIIYSEVSIDWGII